MHVNPLAVAALALAATVPAVDAAAQTGCRGETLAELNACVAATTPQATAPVEVRPNAPARARIGGAIAPTNLRAAPPVRRVQNAPVEAEAQALPEADPGVDLGDIGARYYGLGDDSIRIDRRTGQIIEVVPVD